MVEQARQLETAGVEKENEEKGAVQLPPCYVELCSERRYQGIVQLPGLTVPQLSCGAAFKLYQLPCSVSCPADRKPFF